MNSRLAYLDNMKILLVVGVVAVHCAVTYGFDGTWYLESYDEMAGGLVDALTVVIVIGWLFGLGLFFLIAGRLSGPSLDRKGPARFARERAIRLGAPVLAYMRWSARRSSTSTTARTRVGRGGFWSFFGDQVWHLGPGPTWFLEALLAFSLGYALLRALAPADVAAVTSAAAGRHVAGIVLAIALSSFAAHLAWPIGSEQFHLQLGMFPQYLILFSLGAAAGRRGWLETLTPPLQRGCGLAAALTALAMPAILLAGDFFAGGAAEDRFAGGWHWQAAAASLTEGVLATCVCAVGHRLFPRPPEPSASAGAAHGARGLRRVHRPPARARRASAGDPGATCAGRAQVCLRAGRRSRMLLRARRARHPRPANRPGNRRRPARLPGGWRRGPIAWGRPMTRSAAPFRAFTGVA